jgi:hypothetical protein
MKPFDGYDHRRKKNRKSINQRLKIKKDLKRMSDTSCFYRLEIESKRSPKAERASSKLLTVVACHSRWATFDIRLEHSTVLNIFQESLFSVSRAHQIGFPPNNAKPKPMEP